jgi:hypothetical protein
VDEHRLAEARSFAYHRVVAQRIRQDPSVLTKARGRVERWITEGRAPYYATAWQHVSSPTADVCDLLVADTDEARALRQTSPFAGVIGPRERWRIWAQVRDGAAAGRADEAT